MTDMTNEQIRERQKNYIESIKPISDFRTAFYSYTMPTMIVHTDGEIEFQYNFTPEQKVALKQCDELLEFIKQKHLHN